MDVRYTRHTWTLQLRLVHTVYCPHTREKLMVSLVDPNFVVIGQTPFCPIHHRTLSSHSPFVSRRELARVKALVAFVRGCNNASLFFLEFQ